MTSPKRNRLPVDHQQLLRAIGDAERAAAGLKPWHPDEPREAWVRRAGAYAAWNDSGVVRVGNGWLGNIRAMRRRRSKALRRLEAAGLLRLVRSSGRIRYVALTDAGRLIAEGVK